MTEGINFDWFTGFQFKILFLSICMQQKPNLEVFYMLNTIKEIFFM